MTLHKRTVLPMHPVADASAVALDVEAAVARVGSVLQVQFRLVAARPVLRLPASREGERRDGLWQHTCCELFLSAPERPDYLEVNLSPSGDWAVYQFSDYRIRAGDVPATAPTIHVHWDREDLWVEANIDTASWSIPWLADATRVGLSAVLELTSGVRAYHALAHPRDVPDFHDARGWLGALDGFSKGA